MTANDTLLPLFFVSGSQINAQIPYEVSGATSVVVHTPDGASAKFNVNVPDVAASELRGIEVTRLGKRHKAEPVVRMQTPRGDTAYWIGAAGAAAGFAGVLWHPAIAPKSTAAHVAATPSRNLGSLARSVVTEGFIGWGESLHPAWFPCDPSM